MAVENAVVTAVITNADTARARRHREAAQGAGRTRARQPAAPADIAGATFTISNLGMFNVDAFTAIIVPPQAGILAVGAIADRVVAVDGMIGVRPMMTMTLSSDHRRGRRRAARRVPRTTWWLGADRAGQVALGDRRGRPRRWSPQVATHGSQTQRPRRRSSPAPARASARRSRAGWPHEGVNLVLLARGKEALDAGRRRDPPRARASACWRVPADVRDIDARSRRPPTRRPPSSARSTSSSTTPAGRSSAPGPADHLARRGLARRRQPEDDRHAARDAGVPAVDADATAPAASSTSAASPASSAFIGRADARPQQLGDEPGDDLPGQGSGGRRITVNTRDSRADRHRVARRAGPRRRRKQQGKTKEEFLDEICRQWGIVSGRWATMEEVADLVVFLASDRAGYDQRRADCRRRRLYDQRAIA